MRVRRVRRLVATAKDVRNLDGEAPEDLLLSIHNQPLPLDLVDFG